MQITQTLDLPDRAAWREWLQEHRGTEPEIWLVFYRKDSGRPRISYNDAVEEALCFGWIDSTVKRLDEQRFAQRFSPRKPRSGYSQTNKERLRRLVEQGRVADDVLARLGPLLSEGFEVQADLLDALRSNSRAWENFQRFSGAYQRIRLAFIEAARDRPEEFEKRLRHFIRMTEQGRKFGHDIESYY